ncbi:SDR family NAD(P)-dependent oxidoreductase [Aspergillus candidus]|uniref:Short chain dehydrogenase/reductase family n=1 Tax=Aspergillus candidus TaxID=41067 RepID=A0A2I2FA65_ASPCN|nr:short chain dehydrogenase/reductase family [Aspergillus candidus]PLB37523.1 short chain dehydrogenase/reductase family [Aspergillus candidus]
MSLNAASLFSVQGLVTVITGGGTGLGRTMALAFDANGAAKVFILGRREQPLQETAAQATNKTIIPVVADISSHASLETAYQTIASQTTHIDLLVGNSAVPGSAVPRFNPDGSQPTLTEFRDRHFAKSMSEFTDVFDVNVTGNYYTILALLPLLDKANHRRALSSSPDVLAPPRPQVILISSIGGILHHPASVAYGLSKAAVLQMVKVMSALLAPYLIRVNGIAPGLFWTELSRPLFRTFGIDGRGLADGSVPASNIPITRAGAPQDLAGLVLWMASASGGFLNGDSIVYDGGRSKVSL